MRPSYLFKIIVFYLIFFRFLGEKKLTTYNPVQDKVSFEIVQTNCYTIEGSWIKLMDHFLLL